MARRRNTKRGYFGKKPLPIMPNEKVVLEGNPSSKAKISLDSERNNKLYTNKATLLPGDLEGNEQCGGDNRTRTCDLLRVKQAL